MTIIRCLSNPIITPSSGSIGTNINGPCVVRVPSWVKAPRGRYYLYFAHHKGEFIRLAVADRPEGPWAVQADSPLHIAQLTALGYRHHVASPDVIIDEKRGQWIMFFHAPNRAWRLEDTPGLRTHFSQATGMAISRDGLVDRKFNLRSVQLVQLDYKYVSRQVDS